MPKDNILLITTDQQRFDTVNAWGNRSIFTPHLNYMAAMGISYTNCYASCPICMPSRTTIMTGRQGFESGVITNANHQVFMQACTDDRSTLPAVLTDAGYQTCAKGKMHFEPARAHYGFEHMRLPLDYMREYDKKQPQSRPKVHGIGECEMEPVISTVDVKDSVTTWIADEAIDFLETRDDTRPFFLWTSFTKPHPPFDPCRDFWDLYENIPLPAPVTGDWSESIEKTPQGFLAGAYENTNMHLFGDAQKQASRRAYYACITQVDYQLGRIFGALREHDLFKNTWIVFTSDHGEMLGDHHMSQKNLFFEGSAHVPLLIVPPAGRGIAHNLIVDAPTDLADIYPTILAMAGLSSPVPVSGKNLLAPEALSYDRLFFGNSLNKNFCVMEKKIKLVYSAVGDHTLLFDLNTDPMEQRDLSSDPAWASEKSRLFALLLEHTAAHTPEALEESGYFSTEPAPRFPGDMPGRWFGFHYKDYTVDTFH
ncbi:MAG: sulfatase-like hydrolase/transferase [Lachnospiraceae bacterium]|nr:sulfatase-like hydrolase/transferase [Lachnospiraceae bacterium]